MKNIELSNNNNIKQNMALIQLFLFEQFLKIFKTSA